MCRTVQYSTVQYCRLIIIDALFEANTRLSGDVQELSRQNNAIVGVLVYNTARLWVRLAELGRHNQFLANKVVSLERERRENAKERDALKEQNAKYASEIDSMRAELEMLRSNGEPKPSK